MSSPANLAAMLFSLMVNGSPSQNRAKRVENLVGAQLASYVRPAGNVPAVVLTGSPP